MSRTVWWALVLGALLGCGERLTDAELTTPLEVVVTVPSNGGVLEPTGFLQVTFNKDVDVSSLEEGVQIIGVPATFTYDRLSRTVTLVPVEPLTPGRAYTLVVSRVVAVDGSKLKNVFTVSFTCEKESP